MLGVNEFMKFKLIIFFNLLQGCIFSSYDKYWEITRDGSSECLLSSYYEEIGISDERLNPILYIITLKDVEYLYDDYRYNGGQETIYLKSENYLLEEFYAFGDPGKKDSGKYLITTLKNDLLPIMTYYRKYYISFPYLLYIKQEFGRLARDRHLRTTKPDNPIISFFYKEIYFFNTIYPLNLDNKKIKIYLKNNEKQRIYWGDC